MIGQQLLVVVTYFYGLIRDHRGENEENKENINDGIRYQPGRNLHFPMPC